ncbi:transcription factor S-II, central domain-containing protein [Hyaloraphidium curvatum]|nr:transcription factor S-II, central domain-containing protein [Hyaloraphidium curvatum]
MALSPEDIEQIKRDIEKAIPGELNLVKDCLDRLAEVKATADLLKKTEIGAFVNKLRKNPDVDEAISERCKDIVRKWKDDVGSKDEKKPKEEKEAKVKDEKVENGKLKIETKVESELGSQSSGGGLKSAETPLTERREGRTPAEDGVSLPRTGHTSRDKCSEMIYTALSYVTWVNPELVGKVATSVEQQTWEEYGNKDPDNKKYKDRVRSLVFNLKAKDNPGLRENVVTGKLPVADFCKMTTADMASDDLKKEWEKIQKQNLLDAQIHADNSAETDMFKCGKCKQRRTKYYQMQTRSADEPMTTFVTCLNCGNRWKFC